MALPDKALFTVAEAQVHLAFSKPTIYKLIKSGDLKTVYPRPRSVRITRESLEAVATRTKEQAQAAAQQGQQIAAVQHQAQQEEKKKSLLGRWLGGGRG